MSEQEYAAFLLKRKQGLPGVSTPKRTEVAVKPKPERRGRMNGLETRYCKEVLDVRKHEGTVIDYWFEPIRFRMAKATNYTPDLVVQAMGKWEIHEVKGRGWIHDMVRLKTCAEMVPFARLFDFYLCRRVDGIWQIKRVG